jgi:hypothetical protein
LKIPLLNEYLGVLERAVTYIRHPDVALECIRKYTNSQAHVKKLKIHNYDHSPHTLAHPRTKLERR